MHLFIFIKLWRLSGQQSQNISFSCCEAGTLFIQSGGQQLKYLMASQAPNWKFIGKPSYFIILLCIPLWYELDIFRHKYISQTRSRTLLREARIWQILFDQLCRIEQIQVCSWIICKYRRRLNLSNKFLTLQCLPKATPLFQMPVSLSRCSLCAHYRKKSILGIIEMLWTSE